MTWNTELEPKRLRTSLTVSVCLCLSLFVSNLLELTLLLLELSISFRELWKQSSHRSCEPLRVLSAEGRSQKLYTAPWTCGIYFCQSQWTSCSELGTVQIMDLRIHSHFSFTQLFHCLMCRATQLVALSPFCSFYFCFKETICLRSRLGYDLTSVPVEIQMAAMKLFCSCTRLRKDLQVKLQAAFVNQDNHMGVEKTS